MNHSPSGRVGPSGPERVYAVGRHLEFGCVKIPPRSLQLPTSRREGVATLFKQTTQKLHDPAGEKGCLRGSHG
jgi:hypothetical protein